MRLPREAGSIGRIPADVIVLSVHRYLRFSLTFRDVEELPAKISRATSSSRALPLKLSTNGFSHGLPGSMYAVPVPLWVSTPTR